MPGTLGCSPIAATHNFRGCLLKRETNQSIPNTTGTPVAFTAEEFDTDNFHDNSTNNTRITIPSNKGIRRAQLMANVRFNAHATGYRSAYIMKNGSAIVLGTPIMRADAASSSVTCFNITTPQLSVVDGDYFELIVDQTSGGALDLDGVSGQTWFSLKVVE